MKVTQSTKEKLIIDNRPVWPGLLAMTFIMIGVGVAWNMTIDQGDITGVLIGVPFVGMGALAFWAFVRRSQIIFDRVAGTIDIRRKSLTSQTRVVHDLADFDRAEVETSGSSDSQTHRAVLILSRGMSAGRHPVTEAYYSGRGAERIAATINAWR
ncbi:hypothetical protein [Shimia ponticola]|uniref:hypothetical protein n=1 Tax=Shimia ponticola TaxID=2582893 RepID=UPI0011BF989D|nr:hypothetical protein [Shimia ponticola]